MDTPLFSTDSSAVSLAPTDAEFINDCWHCLQAVETRWPLSYASPSTPLECMLVKALAFELLAFRRNHEREHVCINAGVQIVFRGAVTMLDVSDEAWACFGKRVRAPVNL
jgi:hypothetical protein